MLNSCVLTGNLGADPEVFYSSSGHQVASFNLAFKAAKDKTGWIKVVCFNRLAEVVEEYLHKGARVGVAGSLDPQTWKTEDGQNRSALRLLANNVEFIKTNGQGQEENPTHENGSGEDADDLPF